MRIEKQNDNTYMIELNATDKSNLDSLCEKGVEAKREDVEFVEQQLLGHLRAAHKFMVG